MIERVLNDFDIDQIANSGQCFRFHRVGDKSYNLIAGTHLLNIQQNGRTVRFDCDEDEFNAIWRPYFDLDADYGRCKAAVAKRDTYLQNAVAYGGGLRILRQDLWETILCFIISQQNNIARITKCVENLCSLFGETCYNKSEQVYNSIPTAERLAACTPEDLAPVRLGYRAKYIHRLIQDVLAGNVSLESLAALPPDEAMTALTSLYGIGPKVANCVCLFGLHHIDAFPVDTWIEQILTKEYLPKHPIRYRRLPKSRLYTTIIQDFFGSYKGYAGVMQQYIFYYERSIRNGKS